MVVMYPQEIVMLLRWIYSSSRSGFYGITGNIKIILMVDALRFWRMLCVEFAFVYFFIWSGVVMNGEIVGLGEAVTDWK